MRVHGSSSSSDSSTSASSSTTPFPKHRADTYDPSNPPSRVQVFHQLAVNPEEPLPITMQLAQWKYPLRELRQQLVNQSASAQQLIDFMFHLQSGLVSTCGADHAEQERIRRQLPNSLFNSIAGTDGCINFDAVGQILATSKHLIERRSQTSDCSLSCTDTLTALEARISQRGLEPALVAEALECLMGGIDELNDKRLEAYAQHHNRDFQLMSAPVERGVFGQTLQVNPTGLRSTLEWIEELVQKPELYGQSPDDLYTLIPEQSALHSTLVHLVSGPRSMIENIPETLSADADHLKHLQDAFNDMVRTHTATHLASFVASNAGASFSEAESYMLNIELEEHLQDPNATPASLAEISANHVQHHLEQRDLPFSELDRRTLIATTVANVFPGNRVFDLGRKRLKAILNTALKQNEFPTELVKRSGFEFLGMDIHALLIRLGRMGAYNLEVHGSAYHRMIRHTQLQNLIKSVVGISEFSDTAIPSFFELHAEVARSLHDRIKGFCEPIHMGDPGHAEELVDTLKYLYDILIISGEFPNPARYGRLMAHITETNALLLRLRDLTTVWNREIAHMEEHLRGHHVPEQIRSGF